MFALCPFIAELGDRSAALYERFSSRGEADFADKLMSAMRFQFGGHHELSTGVQP